MGCQKKLPSLRDYQKPIRDYVLPDLPRYILRKLGKPNKPVILKKDIIEKNKNNHPELSLKEYNNIITNALYNPAEIIQSNFKNKPNYFNFLARSNSNNDVVIIELAENKNNYELVGFWKLNDDKLRKMELKASLDGGQSVITKGINPKGQQPTSALQTGDIII